MLYVKKRIVSLIVLGVFLLCNSSVFAKILQGDANGDGKVDGVDFSIWLSHYGQSLTGASSGDFNTSGKVDGVDFALWLSNYGKTPTNSQTPTTAPTNTPSGPTPTNPPISQQKGIWISSEELAKLPTSGAAWDKLQSTANGSWGSACLYDLNCPHDTNTLAGALVAARLNDSAMRNKTIGGITSAMNATHFDRVLELSRGLQSYIIAADIIGYRTPAFESWVRSMITKPLQGHSGGKNIYETAQFSSNNWGGHSRASLAAAAIYLSDSDYTQKVVAAHKAFIGIAPSSSMVYTGTTWHASSNKAGENRKGAVISGKNVSGVLPEDWRRGTDFQWPPTVSGYMWEGMQGYVATAVILHRAGLIPFSAGDNAVVRALDMVYGTGEAAANSPVFKNPAESDDTWIPWTVNYYGNANFPTTAASPGKGIGWTDWMYE
jgi:hypothetical protein